MDRSDDQTASGQPKSSSVGDDTDTGTFSDEKEQLGKLEASTPPQDEDDIGRSSQSDGKDIEAQRDNVGTEKLETVKSNSSRKSHRSVLSKISKVSKTPEKMPPTVLPVTDLDNGIVGWDGQDDPQMPLNFAANRKWFSITFLSIITFMTPFTSTILAPAIGFYSEEFGVTNVTLGAMPVSIFLLGYSVGPLFLSPLSEIYGRNIVLTTSNAFFCVWIIGCALAPSLDSLIAFRFLSGIGGSACQTIGGAIVADLFPVAERGRAMTFWLLGPLFGPSLAPVIGGFVSESIGWRWTCWLSLIPATIATIAMGVLNPETNHEVLMQRKTNTLRVKLNRPELRSCYVDPEKPVLTKKDILLIGLTRPLRMLFTSAILFLLSLYIAFVYGTLYLLFNTMPVVFQSTYGWSIGISGLVYLTVLIGYTIGLATFSAISDKTVVRMTAANGGVFEPEMRLPNSIWFAVLMPVTFFWYGWSADQHTHWIVPVIGLVPFGIATVGVWMPIQTYIIDAWPQYAASGLAAFAVLRCLGGAFLPLAGPQMYESLGIGWGTSMLGFISIAMIPIPTLTYKYGKRLRQRYPIKL